MTKVKFSQRLQKFYFLHRNFEFLPFLQLLLKLVEQGFDHWLFRINRNHRQLRRLPHILKGRFRHRAIVVRTQVVNQAFYNTSLLFERMGMAQKQAHP